MEKNEFRFALIRDWLVSVAKNAWFSDSGLPLDRHHRNIHGTGPQHKHFVAVRITRIDLHHGFFWHANALVVGKWPVTSC